MIGKLKGMPESIHDGYVIVDVKGVGYKVFMTEIGLGKLSQEKEAEIFVHTNVKEDHIKLFGFENIEELELFELLLSISGIGPKASLSILTIATPATIKSAIAQEDISILTQVSGIGKKTAERVVLELKNKVDLSSVSNQDEVISSHEVVEALMAMGYSVKEARDALKTVPDNIKDLSEKIKIALKAC